MKNIGYRGTKKTVPRQNVDRQNRGFLFIEFLEQLKCVLLLLKRHLHRMERIRIGLAMANENNLLDE